MLLDIIAPWIIESWREALWAVSFDIRPLGLHPYQAHLAMAATALLLLAIFWHSVAHLPLRARWPARVLMCLALMAPASAFVAVHMDAIANMPKFAGRVRVAPAAPSSSQVAERAPVIIKPQILPAAVALAETKLSASSGAEPRLQSSPDLATIAAPPMSVIATEPESPPTAAAITPPPAPPLSPTAAATATVKRVALNLQRLLPKPSETDLMPIFYGTDRVADTQSPRLDYTSERAGRLELGRAFVSVPRRHQKRQGDHPWSAVNSTIKVQSIPGHDLETQFAVQDIKSLSRDEILNQAVMRLALSRRFKDQALIFVPGFNTSFDASLFRAAQIAYDLQFDGAPFVYSWPSAGRVAQYTYDRDSVSQSAAHFADFVRIVVQQSGARTVNFIAHGLGASLTLEAIAALKGQLPAGVSIGELVLAAPDVERIAFAAQISALDGVARRTTLYAASSDRALNISRRYSGGVPRAGDVLETGPMVLPGVETVDVSAPGTEIVSLNHSSYVAQSALARDLATRFANGGASDASPGGPAGLESVPTPKGTYQRYRPEKHSSQ